MGRYWSDEPRQFTIDLAGVTTPERLRDALAKHFDLLPDIRRMSCAFSLASQECPYHIEFLHWADFQQHMPRYARRLKRRLDEYARWRSHALVVEYGPGVAAPVKRPVASRQSVPAPEAQRMSVPPEECRPPLSANSVYQPLNYIVLESVTEPTVEQIRTFRELRIGGCGYSNMLEIRRILLDGGYTCFGELLEDRAKQVSSRLSAVGIPHRIEKTPIRQIIFTKTKGK